ncbi:hypothetical protein JCM3770_001276 [Rhodotorula araucariae]
MTLRTSDDEVEALAETVESHPPVPRERKKSPTPSEEGLLFPGLVDNGEERRRPSTDGASFRSAKSSQSVRSHPYATAKNYFPLVSERKKGTPSAGGEDSAGEAIPTTPSPAVTPETETPPTAQQVRRKSSGALSAALSTRASSVFPTITPTRSAGASVFPLRVPSGTPSQSPTPPHSGAASTRSGPASGLPSPPASRLSTSASSPNFTLPFSAAGSSYAPSIAQSNRSGATSRNSSKPFLKPSYAGSQAPSHAEAYYGSAVEPVDGPSSIFLNPVSQPRSMKELLPLPKKKLSSFFGMRKSKSSPSSTLGAVHEGAPAGPTHRVRSAAILDAALATSEVWAAHRGERSRMPAHPLAPSAAAFGAPAGYRPAHQVRRQEEEEAARLANAGAGAGVGTGTPQPMMGGGGEDPVSQAAIAEAFARNQGGADGGLAHRGSIVSLASVADIETPASTAGRGTFPVRQDVFAAYPRARRPAGASPA